MIKIRIEDVGGCAIPAKTSYGNSKISKNEIYYFGNPPKKPETLSNYLKKSNKKDQDSK